MLYPQWLNLAPDLRATHTREPSGRSEDKKCKMQRHVKILFLGIFDCHFKNFYMPLQWYSVSRIIAAILQYFPPFGRVQGRIFMETGVRTSWSNQPLFYYGQVKVKLVKLFYLLGFHPWFPIWQLGFTCRCRRHRMFLAYGHSDRARQCFYEFWLLKIISEYSSVDTTNRTNKSFFSCS